VPSPVTVDKSLVMQAAALSNGLMPVSSGLTHIQPTPVQQPIQSRQSALDVDKGGSRNAVRSAHREPLDKLKEEERELVKRRQLLQESLKAVTKVKIPGSSAIAARERTHRDIVLEEMSWMATDFSEERRWKRSVGATSSIALREHFEARERQMAARQQV
jgi:hypothetical protein